jgi:hypothetical protein
MRNDPTSSSWGRLETILDLQELREIKMEAGVPYRPVSPLSCVVSYVLNWHWNALLQFVAVSSVAIQHSHLSTRLDSIAALGYFAHRCSPITVTWANFGLYRPLPFVEARSTLFRPNGQRVANQEYSIFCTRKMKIPPFRLAPKMYHWTNESFVPSSDS